MILIWYQNGDGLSLSQAADPFKPLNATNKGL